ncbi:peripheral-type benzodiazepine receptor [Tsukamurella pulmonis]|uniref:TspO/MBR family protein n=1 Tax=Tsukamurella pulmonis TaxID=47312 RepID=UPI000792E0C0|nr:TspO/MBR family protein [Tsukamurella pulmonis]KXP09739.1 peripheral-type benzodiazepine receptor [Tsukamurella pulmonis]RDH11370.1 tryptophan-rich sensory protein [Tsukamurella pulmonis]
MTGSPVSRGSLHPLALVVSLIAVAVVAFLGGLASADAADEYGALAQPPWAPPSWLFGPAWGVLYLLMAIAAWLVWRVQPSFGSRAIQLYTVQLLVNLSWSPLFFGLELRGIAFGVIVLLDVLVVATIAAFWAVRRSAALLLLPYLGWILFASALNYSVWILNA